MDNPYGVFVSRPYEKEKIPDCCQVIPMPDTWVSNALKDTINRWCYGQPILIKAPTGSGKTTFVQDIVRHCRKKRIPNKVVLLLVSRTAIAIQQRLEFAKKFNSKWYKVKDESVFQYVDYLDDVGILIMTYQNFSANYKSMDLKKIDWVVMDEAHYFLSDSLFNAYLDPLFWKLPELFKHANRLYLTATPGAVLDDICAAESKMLHECAVCPHRCQNKGTLLLYDFPDRYNNVQLSYFRNVDEIVDLVKSHPNDQFLIFTSKRETSNSSGSSYVKSLDNADISVDYLDSKSKQSDTWASVCNQGHFNSQVLVATSVLDCGISLHNPSLRHIVVESTDKTEFLQMIGRRRLYPGESINVYIRAVSPGTLLNRLNRINQQLALIAECFQAAHTKNFDLLLHKGWRDEDESRPYMHLLNYLGSGRLSPKKTAYHQLLWQQATLERLLRDAKNYQDDSALPRLAHKWLNQIDGYDPSRWLDYNRKKETRGQLMTLLETHLNKKFSKSECNALAKQLLPLVNAIQKFSHDLEEDTKRTPRTMNQRFEALQIPFRFVKNSGSPVTYSIQRQETEG